ncbi:putative pyruvate ferredoxin/flavodoxin oxidoreductase [Bordetella holmesii 44057]|nr:putative pyruvate ferredoxin/flavodoxin oxidoreductase [Bordetella holmesii 44057]
MESPKALDANQITFMPGINEDLAATAVMGTQQVGTRDDRKVDGVYAMWPCGMARDRAWIVPATPCIMATRPAPRATAAC